MSQLLLLPPELTIEILLHLDVADAYAIQAVNHALRNIYKTSVQLQYALECKVAYVRDNPNCRLPIGERLEMLRRREAAWRSMKPTLSQMIPMPKDMDVYDIERNHYIVGKQSGHGLYSLSIQEFENHSFRLIPVDGLVDFCCCIDEHDLIACLTKTIHLSSYLELRIELLQHSTGIAHPLAEKPSIFVCRELLEEVNVARVSMTMEIFGENLVLSLAVEGAEQDCFTRLYTFDWKKGHAKCMPIPVSNTGIIVLDKDLFLVPDNNSWLLYIYYIPPSPVYDPPQAIRKLRLPPLKEHTAIHWSQCRSAPNPTGDGEFPRHIPSSLPFMDQPETALISFQYCLDSEHLSMIVHRHSIMNLLPSRSDWSTMVESQTIDWDAWGPPVTLWDEMQVPYSHITTTNGQRYIQSTAYHYGEPFLQDFNKYNVRRYSTKTPSTFVPEHVFLNPVRSELPFIKVYSGMRPVCEYLSLADGIIVGTQDHIDNINHGGNTEAVAKVFYFT